MDEWIVDVISFQKIFGLCGLKCHIVEIWRDVTVEASIVPQSEPFFSKVISYLVFWLFGN